MMNRGDGDLHGERRGTESGSMQGTAEPSSAADVGPVSSRPARFTPPSSPKDDADILPNLPGKGLDFELANRNLQSYRLNQTTPPILQTTTAPHHLYSPLPSHPTSPRRASNTSQSSGRALNSPRIRQALTSTPSPIPSPRMPPVPNTETSSPTSFHNRPIETLLENDSNAEESLGLPSPLKSANSSEPLRPVIGSSRVRGQTTSGNAGSLPQQRILRSATSIPDYGPYRAGQRSTPSATYRPDRGVLSHDSNTSAYKRDPSRHNESIRNSIRSGITVASSSFLDASGTERSSIATKSDTASEFNFHLSQTEDTEDSKGPRESRISMSVEDAIGMYEKGFHDDPETVEFKDEGYSSQATVARTSSAKDIPTSSSQLEHSTSLEEGNHEKHQLARTLSLPKNHHIRSSTQLMAGRTSATPSTLSELSPPAPRDRYGFKKITQNIKEVEYDVWNFHYIPYLERRRKKWISVMKQHGLSCEKPTQFPPPSDKVKRFVRKGIPPDWRGAAWFWYAGGPEQLTANPMLYRKLLQQVEDGHLSDLDREHIERDLHRTFPDNIRFKPEVPPSNPGSETPSSERPESTLIGDTPILQALRRVLQAFAIHNPGIGYCQSLNFLAGLLLLFLDDDEEKAFIMLDIITNEHLPGTHAKILEANIDIGVLMGCIQESMPLIWAKIDDTSDPSTGASHITTAAARLPTVSLALTSWFMSVFVSSLPIETVLRVWDCFFYEGSKTLFRIALAIFKLGENQIRAISDPMEVFQLVQTIPRRLINPNVLLEACFKKRNGFGHLSQETIDARRAERRKLHADDVQRLTGQKLATDLVDRKPSLRRAASRSSRFKRSLSRKRA